MQSKTIEYLEIVALIALGGFAGSNIRYLLGSAIPGIESTLIVNGVGSFLLGFLLYESIHIGIFSKKSKYAIGTGFLASLTTYSTFAVQTFSLPSIALINIFSNYLVGFTGIFIGRYIALNIRRI